MLYVDLPPGGQGVRVVEGGDQLVVTVHASEVPQVGLWINNGGWNPLPRTSWLPWRKPAPYFNLGVEPALGAPGALADALGAWESAQWISPGATRRWSVTWTGGKVPPPASPR